MSAMAFTLLHTADLHLGKSFRTLPPERAGQRRADLLATLQRICRTARERQVDLLCIAGDLFDRPTPPPALLADVRRALEDARVPVALIPGNHDPLQASSPYLAGHWPGHVHIATVPGWQRLPFDRELWAFGYTLGDAHRHPWQDFPGSAEAIVLLHAACLAPGLATDAGYYAFTPAEIPPCAYLALGHHHRACALRTHPPAWYAGAPEPLEAQEEPAATLLVTLGTETRVEPLALATRRHRLRTLEVQGLSAEEIWTRALAEVFPDDLLTLRLSGVLDPAEPLDLIALQAELDVRCFAGEVDARGLLLPSTLAAQADGVLGALYAEAAARHAALSPDDPARPRLERAVRYAVLALEGRL